MPTDATLTKIQKNRILRLVDEYGPPPAEFFWSEELQGHPASGYYRVSVLWHRPTEYSCIFGAHDITISPGWEKKVQYFRHESNFERMENLCGKWLILVKLETEAPDLWAALRLEATERLNQTELANAALEQANSRTAARELREANVDLSRRPPDLTGAIQHSLAALECVAREHCDDSSTFGKLLERYSDLFPKPLDKGIEKIWGFASEMGRHLREGRIPSHEEAELLVGLATVCCTYLARKIEAGAT